MTHTLYKYAGTEKQITWLNDIFSKMFAQLDELQETVKTFEFKKDTEARREKMVLALEQIRKSFMGENFFKTNDKNTFLDCSGMINKFGYTEIFDFSKVIECTDLEDELYEKTSNVINAIYRKLNN